MKKLKIKLDFIAGPLWKDIYDIERKELVTGIDIVDEDEKVQRINQKIQDLYSSYYHIDHENQPIYFDEEQEKKDKGKMLGLLEKLIYL